MKVGFAFVPARRQPAIDTLVPHEGGPGYSTTGTGADYAAMYGPLLDRRNLLLVDQRGTGLSQPLRCPDLQHLKLEYSVAAGRCGRSLGKRADDYTTPRSADDLAAVLKKLGLTSVSLYGDSYGRSSPRRSPVGTPRWCAASCSTVPTRRTASPAGIPPRARPCGPPSPRSASGPRSAGRPGGGSCRPCARCSLRCDGGRGRARRTTPTVSGPRSDWTALHVTDIAFGATYTPAFYRELTAALRSGLRGDRAPLLRLAAEAVGGGTDAGPVKAYSEGLDAAVACHDYPQLYNMKAPPGAVRERQLARAVAARTRTDPHTYSPFTVREYADSDWQALDWCTRWPVAPADNPAGPIRPTVGYPDVPVLVMSGELDSITTAAEGDLVASQFPNARHIVVRNSFHVTALSDRDGCGERILRAFVRAPGSERRLSRCAKTVQPVRALGLVPRTLGHITPARAARELPVKVRRAGPAAALTVADVVDRWWHNYDGSGVGLHGGTFSYTGYVVVKLRLQRYRLLQGLAVSGLATWDRDRKRMRVDLTLDGALHGRLRGGWHTRAVGAEAVLHGVVSGKRVRLTFPAP